MAATAKPGILTSMHLPAIQTAHQRLALLSLDIMPRLAAQFGLDLTVKANEEALRQLLQDFSRHVVPAFSGVILDPVYSYELMDRELGEAGLLFRLEKLTAELDTQTLPTLIPNWGVAQIRQHYAWAKLELPYHPAEANALAKKQLVAELGDYCKHEGIGFLLKLVVSAVPHDTAVPVTPSEKGAPPTLTPVAQFQLDQLTAATEMARLVNVLALQDPQDALAAATLTAELDIPWIVALEPQKEYEQVKEILRMTLDNGAQGFMVDEALWPEIYQFRAEDGHTPDWVKIGEFLSTTGRDRAIELARIADESGQ